MPSLDKILDRKKDVSGQVSAQTRTLALGMLAISWALLTVHDEPLRTMAGHVYRPILLWLAICSVLVIAFDLLQYVAGTEVADDAAARAEKATPKEALYNAASFAYRFQEFCYRVKFVLLTVAAVILAIVFVRLFTNSGNTPTPAAEKAEQVQCECVAPLPAQPQSGIQPQAKVPSRVP